MSGLFYYKQNRELKKSCKAKEIVENKIEQSSITMRIVSIHFIPFQWVTTFGNMLLCRLSLSLYIHNTHKYVCTYVLINNLKQSILYEFGGNNFSGRFFYYFSLYRLTPIIIAVYYRILLFCVWEI